MRRWKESAFYPGFRRSAKVYRFILRLKASLGLGKVHTSSLQEWKIKDFINDALPHAATAVALVGTSGPAQKLIVQIWDDQGVIGYLKYAETPAALRRLSNECTILSSLPIGLGPTVLKHGPVHNGRGLLLSPIAGRMLPVTLPPSKSVDAFLHNIPMCPPVKMSDHPWVQENLQDCGRHIMPWLEVLTDRKWPVVHQHGDLAPWNLIKASTGEVAIDWEYGSIQGFPYLDFIQYCLQVGALINRWSPSYARHKTLGYLRRRFPEITQTEGHSLITLAGYYAFREALVDGHSGNTYLQSWRQVLWKEAVDQH